jgi:uncharacterized damage-inducible protein DinB
MSSTATPAAPARTTVNARTQLIDVLEAEFPRTLRVLRAFPKDQSELRPHPNAKTARELAFMFVAEQGAVIKTITTGWDWSKPQQFPTAPDSFDEVIAAYEQNQSKMVELLRSSSDEALQETIQMPAGPGKFADMPKIQFLWMMLCDQIHHRGQLSVYLRMAGGKVPSIYGPSFDEPWR